MHRFVTATALLIATAVGAQAAESTAPATPKKATKAAAPQATAGPQVAVLETSLGVIVIKLDDKEAPKTSANFKKLDTNKDGRISQAEAAVDSSIVFSSADTNGDGYLDSDEWKAASKGSNTPQSQPQSQPSDTPDTTSPPSSDMPRSVPPSGDRSPDTETPRQ